MYLSQAYNNEVIPTFLQDEEEAEGDKDAMKRMFIETEVCFLDFFSRSWVIRESNMFLAMAFGLDSGCINIPHSIWNACLQKWYSILENSR